ncbi:MAG: hypothetical protein ABW039_08525 [Sphingobium sp.]
MLTGASGEEILEIRRVLEGLALTQAMRRLGTVEVARLRALALKPEGAAPERLSRNTNAMLTEVLRLADNLTLSLFCYALAQASLDRALWHGAPSEAIQQLSEDTWRARLEQIEAMIAFRIRPVLACQRRIAESGAAVHETFLEPPRDVESATERASRLARDYMFSHGPRSVKKPEGIARLIAHRMSSEPGEVARTEAFLIASLKVSRNVLRESIRLLEGFGVARMRPGKDGGLEPVRSNPANVVRATALYLADVGAWSPDGFGRVVLELQSLAVDAAIRRLARAPADVRAVLARFRAWIDEHGDWSVGRI